MADMTPWSYDQIWQALQWRYPGLARRIDREALGQLGAPKPGYFSPKYVWPSEWMSYADEPEVAGTVRIQPAPKGSKRLLDIGRPYIKRQDPLHRNWETIARNTAHEEAHVLDALLRPLDFDRAARQATKARNRIRRLAERTNMPERQLARELYAAYRNSRNEVLAFKAGDTALGALRRAIEKGILRFGGKGIEVAGKLKGSGALKLGGLPALALVAGVAYAAKRAGGTSDPREA